MGFKVIGLVGPVACGKGIVADYLIKKYDYSSFSLSTIVHDELKKRGIATFTRTTLQDIGDDLRRKEGDGIFAKRAIEQLKGKSKKIIIEGIRNPGEVKYLRSIPGFFLISVDAPQETRFKRVLKRSKPWDPKDWETFLKIDGRDSRDDDNRSGQQVRRCMKMADTEIQNDGGKQKVYKAIKALFTTNGFSPDLLTTITE